MRKLHKAIEEYKFWKYWDKTHNIKVNTFIIYDSFLYVNNEGKIMNYEGFSVVRHFRKEFCSKFGEIVI